MTMSRVLLIDDEEELRFSTAQALELSGFAVTMLASAEHALELIGYSFDGVVVSDIRMPGMDGMTLLQKVRELDSGNTRHPDDGPWRCAACRQRHAQRCL